MFNVGSFCHNILNNVHEERSFDLEILNIFDQFNYSLNKNLLFIEIHTQKEEMSGGWLKEGFQTR